MNWVTDERQLDNDAVAVKLFITSFLKIVLPLSLSSKTVLELHDISEIVIQTADFQRFMSVFKCAQDSKTFLEFKIQNEIFGKDPRTEFAFFMKFAVNVFRREFSGLDGFLARYDIHVNFPSQYQSDQQIVLLNAVNDFTAEDFFKYGSFLENVNRIESEEDTTVRIWIDDDGEPQAAPQL